MGEEGTRSYRNGREIDRAATVGRTRQRCAASRLRPLQLLSIRDLEALKSLADIVVRDRKAIFRYWREACVSCLRNEYGLSLSEFIEILRDAVEQAYAALANCDLSEYVARVTRAAEVLVEHGVPLNDVIVSMQLLNTALRAVIPSEFIAADERADAFDKLTHVQIMLIADAYLSSAADRNPKASVTLEDGAAVLSSHADSFYGLIGASPSMRLLYRRIQAASRSRGNLLIVGESGTGKELVGRAVHQCGSHAGGPFVALNCAALPKELIESELFGYKRGAFSGAGNDYAGLFRAAEGGTLLLDEITEMSAETQSKLLRAIQERAIRPVGTTSELPINVRIIAATNRDPADAVNGGYLRQDLYYRLQSATLSIPPLRERRDDIPLLVEHFLRLLSEQLGRTVDGITHDALQALISYDWPGNVRELSNALEGALTFGKGSSLRLEDLPMSVVKHSGTPTAASYTTNQVSEPSSLVGTYSENERALIANALRSNRGNKTRAAAQLMISRKKLYARIAKYHLESQSTVTPESPARASSRLHGVVGSNVS